MVGVKFTKVEAYFEESEVTRAIELMEDVFLENGIYWDLEVLGATPDNE